MSDGRNRGGIRDTAIYPGPRWPGYHPQVGPARARVDLQSMDDLRWDTVWIGSHLATFDPQRPGPWGALRDAALGVRNGQIVWMGPLVDLPGAPEEVATEVRSVPDQWITPGLIDCHTHAVFGGIRADEFDARLRGSSYEEIARAGGGIRSTLRATRAATEHQLRSLAERQHPDIVRDGETTLEIKTGYDLTDERE